MKCERNNIFTDHKILKQKSLKNKNQFIDNHFSSPSDVPICNPEFIQFNL